MALTLGLGLRIKTRRQILTEASTDYESCFESEVHVRIIDCDILD